MQKNLVCLMLLVMLLALSCSTSSKLKVPQKVQEVVTEQLQEVDALAQKFETKKATDANGYTYEYVTNDPTQTRIYTLDNGLKAYLSVYDVEPRIQTLIPVKAGGKFDPENSTGLAHYLEHIMFKGTEKFGTKDWDKEKVLLDSIENMFEHYRTLTDTTARKEWYKKIDEVSNEASKYAIPNEYDKLVQYIGATGTNAYTSRDRTVYINNIPSNQLESWLEIEADRFSTIVNRLFHTELEAVYEEKNRALDNDGRKTYEALCSALFKDHLYGKQSVLGTIDHLKNPSITDIKDYFYKYYVPNNYAICLSGDLDPEATIQMIDKLWGSKPSKAVPTYTPAIEKPFSTPREATVYGPDAEYFSMGYRFGGTSSEDYPYVNMVDMILNNSMAGLIDLNLVQAQKVLEAGCYVQTMNDYSMHTFRGKPREGQSLKEVRDLILGQIQKVKNGEFEPWLMDAIVNDYKKSQLRQLESNYARGNQMIMAFTNDIDWADQIAFIDKLGAITKEQLVAFANKHYNDNYAIVYKKTGEDKKKMKVDKPTITKVELDRTTRSDFFQRIVDKTTPSLSPVFVDYENDLSFSTVRENVPLMYKQNAENELFTLYYLLETGTNENPKLKYATNYLEYLGTKDLSSEEVKQEFYKLGCSLNVFSSEDRIYVYLSGLQENMEEALVLFEDILQNPVPDEEVLNNMVSDAHKQRDDAKKSKRNILWSGLMNYAKYGEDSPFTNVLTNEELDMLTSTELVELIQSIQKIDHKAMYYGPASVDDVTMILNKHHRTPATLLPAPERKIFKEVETSNPKVYWSNYDMVQAEIVFHHKGEDYNANLAPQAKLFNEYFGGMSGIAFQEIREAQGLAYSVFTGYRQANKLDGSDQLMAYVGTQADKQDQAMSAMVNLLNDMPESEQTFQNAKKAILEGIESKRINKTQVFFNYLDAKRKGHTSDIREMVYSKVKDMTFDDLKSFHTDYIKGKKFNFGVIGDKSKLDFDALRKYGTLEEITLDQLFGYKKIVKP